MRTLKRATTVVGLAALFVLGYEGLEHTPYDDGTGVTTVCVGHTHSIDLNKIYTDTECRHLLDKDTLIAAQAVDRLVRVPINDNEKVAYISFVFNVGEGNFAKSTMLRLLNSGQYEAACRQFPRWVYAKGKKLRGLVTRRDAEMAKCLEPVPPPAPENPGLFASLRARLS